ncbi:MAG: hypothetical protein ACR2RF_22180 [Geminicoccaceae bacterium]
MIAAKGPILKGQDICDLTVGRRRQGKLTIVLEMNDGRFAGKVECDVATSDLAVAADQKRSVFNYVSAGRELDFRRAIDSETTAICSRLNGAWLSVQDRVVGR